MWTLTKVKLTYFKCTSIHSFYNFLEEPAEASSSFEERSTGNNQPLDLI